MPSRSKIAVPIIAAGLVSGSVYLWRSAESRGGERSSSPTQQVVTARDALTNESVDARAVAIARREPRSSERFVGDGPHAAARAFENEDSDPLAALTQALASPDTAERRWQIALAIQTWTQREPHAAAAWAEALSDPALRADALASVATAWSYRDAPAAAQWAARVAGEPGAAALSRAVTQWSSAAPLEAGGWIARLPAGLARDRAIAAHVHVLAVEGPRAAAEWLTSLPLAEQPLELLEHLAADWLALNRADAQAWLARTALPVDRKQRLLSGSR